MPLEINSGQIKKYVVCVFILHNYICALIPVIAQTVCLVQGQIVGAIRKNNGSPLGLYLGTTVLYCVYEQPMSTRTISNVDMYADDSTTSACRKNVQEIELKLNNDLQEISNWRDENRMVVNVEKTKIMIVTPRRKWQHLDKTDVSREIKSMWSKVRDYLGFVLIISSHGMPIYKIYTTRLPEISPLCAG